MQVTKLFCKDIFLPAGWQQNTLLTFDKAGNITEIIENTVCPEHVEIAAGAVIPGISNVHSHAFQRAIAGLTQTSGTNKDSFWTWREQMYRFALKMSPEAIEATAAQLYVEMLKSGYTSVGEFHYLHHQQNGNGYDQPAELSNRIIEAAKSTGIGLSLMPVLYSWAGFGSQKPQDDQRRFINSTENYQAIVESAGRILNSDPQLDIALAFHSLRAVSPDQITEVLTWWNRFAPERPIHIHIAEQIPEVEACLDWSEQRPVEWLLNHAPVDQKWCLIHATHLTESETDQMAKSGAVAGLCPTTEADLGDGIFNAEQFLSAGGAISIGSDSHTLVNPAEELRWFEYANRLTKRERNVLRTPKEASTGTGLYKRILAGGAQAMGRKTGKIAVDYRADLLVLDIDHPLLCGKSISSILDTWIFSGGQRMIKDVLAGGKFVVKDKHHIDEDRIFGRFKSEMNNF